MIFNPVRQLLDRPFASLFSLHEIVPFAVPGVASELEWRCMGSNLATR
jgi:hypothetical protein